jgi:glutamyl-tRNA synthetase
MEDPVRMTVRTRFAPSPTGYLHIGGLRTALFAYLFARKYKGRFVLRIEDTDQEREVEGAQEAILASMAAAGLHYDEGPGIGGNYGPYIQSQRKSIYKEHAEELVSLNGAYVCFCTKERLENLRVRMESRGEAYRYDKYCLSISKNEVKARIAAGEPFVIRQNIPEKGVTAFEDMVFGKIEVEHSTLDDNVLLKSDGMPTYNFANVIDDHLMKISHIIRGTEYLSSTPKYNLLYQSFGWEIPFYIHLPPVMKDATRKLSKRYGDASFEDFISKGYLPEAIVNYIALLGWNPGTTEEIFTLKELEEIFSVEGISRSPAIFDVDKLTWMNAEYIRRMEPQEFLKRATSWFKAAGIERFDSAILGRILQPRLERLDQIRAKLAFLNEIPNYDAALFENTKMKTDELLAKEVLTQVKAELESLTVWTEAQLHDALITLATRAGLKNGQILFPMRIALTGMEVTPGGAIEAAILLGRDESIKRLEDAIKKLA